MSMPSEDVLWLTPAARELLVAELDSLTALTGDARQQADGRVLELRRLLRRSDVGDKPDDGLVEPGMTVTVRLGDDATPTTFLFAQREYAGIDPDLELDVFSPTSLIGAAVAGKYPGDTFSYTTPNGASVDGEILAVQPFRG